MGPFAMAAANAPVVRRSMGCLPRRHPYEENSSVAWWSLGRGAARCRRCSRLPPTRYLLKKYAASAPGQGFLAEARDAGKFASEVYAAGPAGIAVARVGRRPKDGGYKRRGA